MENTKFVSGKWNAICDVCGVKFKNTELRKRWDGLMVCDRDFEHRHIADFFKITPEKNNVVDPRHEAEDQFTNVTYINTGDLPYCTNLGRTAIADYAVAGCMIAERTIY